MAACLLLALPACGSSSVAAPDDGKSPPLFVSGRGPGRNVAGNGGVAGTLALNDQGCVYVKAGDSSFIVIWPKGTKRSPDNNSEFRVPGYGKVEIGQRLSPEDYWTLDGPEGYTPSELSSDFPRLASCGSSDSVVMQIRFN